mmetsp:Transcript_8518/g.27908  ORF Transcript_8518/g.27908 Transcript_8518/m.27908 type:complete len:205 (+) Transcript_8518:1038-1652(+)
MVRDRRRQRRRGPRAFVFFLHRRTSCGCQEGGFCFQQLQQEEEGVVVAVIDGRSLARGGRSPGTDDVEGLGPCRGGDAAAAGRTCCGLPAVRTRRPEPLQPRRGRGCPDAARPRQRRRRCLRGRRPPARPSGPLVLRRRRPPRRRHASEQRPRPDDPPLRTRPPLGGLLPRGPLDRPPKGRTPLPDLPPPVGPPRPPSRPTLNL